MPSPFPSIKPGEVDDLIFDFSKKVGSAHLTPTVTVTASVSPVSDVIDPNPNQTLIGGPSVDTAANTVIQRFSSNIDDVTYWLKATVTYNDMRVGIINAEITCSDVPLPPGPVVDVITAEQFRVDFPAFADDVAYTDDAIMFWTAIAVKQLNASRFTDIYTLAQELYVAHQITLERQANLTVLRGGVPLTFGPAASRSVGPVSVSFDFGIAIDQQAGYWNLTMYGMRLWSLIQMYGAGPVQV